MLELIEKRTENSKTFRLDNGRKQLHVSICAIHYKDDYASDEQWKDIDLTWEGNRITKAPYELTRDGNNFTIRDKKSGEVSTIELLNNSPAGLKFEVIPDNVRVRFQHTLPSDKIPFQAQFKVTGNGWITRAFDDDGEIELEATIADGILTEKLSQVKDKATKAVRPVKGNIRVDPTWQVGASTDDVMRRLVASAFVFTEELSAGGAAVDAKQYGSGMRFTNITIPHGAVISSAYLTFTSYDNKAGVTCNTRVSASDEADAVTFSTSNDFDTRWAARTTARVNWDNIGAWTADTAYNSPECKTVEQELVDRGDWASGQDQVWFWEDYEDRSVLTSVPLRKPHSWDTSAVKAPQLVVTYTAPVLVTPSTLALTITTYAPTITVGKTVTPSTLALTLTTYAPTVAVAVLPPCYIPLVKTRIAFVSNPFDAAPTWVDVSSDVVEVHTHRGRKHELDRMEAGTCTLILKNTSGDYYPDNGGGAYTPNVLPMKRISVQASYTLGATYIDVFNGYIESWKPRWQGKSGKGQEVVIQAADGLKVLARKLMNNAGEGEELTGTRVGNVLDDAGWPAADRDIDVGQISAQATGALANVNALAHLQALQESEVGIVYEAPDGDMQFEDRAHRTKAPHDAAVAIFGDDAPELPYEDIDYIIDEALLYNDVRLTRTGGSEQVATVAASQTTYGVRSLSRSGLLHSNDVETEVVAAFWAMRFATPVGRVKSITIRPGKSTGILWPAVLTYDISTRITIRLNQASLDKDYYIEGIRHDWNSKTGEILTKWELSDASQQYPVLAARDQNISPNAAGDEQNINNFTEATAWQSVVDSGTATYVENNDNFDTFDRDLYNLETPAYPAGTINSITVTGHFMADSDPKTIQGRVKLCIKTGGTVFEGSEEIAAVGSWSVFTKSWADNPDTTVAWTWADLAALQAGPSIKRAWPFGGSVNWTRCKYIVVTVNYTPTWA